jgi:carboxylesterase type B
VLAATTNSIIVTINYRLGRLPSNFLLSPHLPGFHFTSRLGVLGMIGHAAFLEETGTFGNYYLMDQIQALRWVQENIRCVIASV